MNQTYIKTKDNIYLFCRDPWCHTGWETIKAIANGCGPEGWKEKIIPDSLLGCNIEEACSIHDVDYQEGQTNEEKECADRTFRNNMQRLVYGRTTTWLAKKLLLKPRLYLTVIYYNAVKNFGGAAFWDKHLKKETI